MDYKALSRKHFNRQAAYYDEKATTTVSKFPKSATPFVRKNSSDIMQKNCWIWAAAQGR